MKRQNHKNGKPGHDPVFHVDLAMIRPSPENDRLYRPVSLDDPGIIELGESVRQFGIREPLVLTLDYFIVSGHRRLAGAKLAGLDNVPCRFVDIRREDNLDLFVFMRRELDRFLKGFYRDLQQSQPNQIEIVWEKNTVASIIRPVAMEYCIPFTIGRGYSSLPPRKKMADRFKRSGKEKLIVLVLSDHDPEGAEKRDAAHLDTVRRAVQEQLAGLDFGDGPAQIRP